MHYLMRSNFLTLLTYCGQIGKTGSVTPLSLTNPLVMLEMFDHHVRITNIISPKEPVYNHQCFSALNNSPYAKHSSSSGALKVTSSLKKKNHVIVWDLSVPYTPPLL